MEYTDDQATLSAPLLRELDETMQIMADSVAIVLEIADRTNAADLSRTLLAFRTAIARARADMRKSL